SKVFVLCCAWAAVSAAPGFLDGIGLSHGYAAPAYAGHAFAAPAYTAQIAHTIAAPAIAAPVVKTIAAPVAVRAEPIDPNPAYSFSYGVQDPATGDHKDASETLQNGVVHGSYSLVEPDGHIRKVTYTADKVNGFNAVVERSGSSHPAQAVAVAAPVAKVLAPAPVAVAAPVAKLSLPASLGHPWR
ncbi:larval cuticle protein A2B-like, partial [Battus philenor]|uniref:larval cuticle protein A2B-like n=1 Tax=Battus philenor TaxID=42288 RepID=UPI0035D0DA70